MSRKIKSSGVFYLGDIPEEWSVAKYKRFTNNRMGETILATQTVESGIPVYSATNDDKVFGYVSKAGLHLSMGDIVIPARGNSIGCATIVKDEIATCTQTTICSKNITLDNKFLYYCCWGLKDEWFKYEGSAIPQITIDQVNNNYMPVPSLKEQSKIAKCLDEKCGEIDSIINKTQASIEEYKILKQSIITQAVTKGVRGGREMKDSGVGCIGKIPTDWTLIKFKYLAHVKSNLVSPYDYPDYMQVSPDNIEKGTGKLLDCKTVNETGVESNNHLFYKGQIIYSKVRPILNKVTIAPFDGLCSADMYPIESEINKEYLVYMMLSSAFLYQVKLVTENRVKMPKINQDELGEIYILNQSSEEQKEIVDFLNSKCDEISQIIDNKETLVSELEMYKKSLIYEYVTGKKEVV